MLGVHLSPQGNNDDEFQYQLKVGKKVAKQVPATPISRLEAAMAYQVIWQKQLEYPLGATTFS